MKKISIYLLAALLFMSCAKPGYEKTTDGIIVNLRQRQNTDVRMVRLQVMNDKVIHVSATPENKFSEENSLIIVPHKYNKVSFSVENKNNAVVLSTSSLKALVNLKTGEVSFTDTKGNSILRENKGGGKSFNPIEVEGTRGYTMRQVFESPDDEAFYGLGQHQSDEFNYKGKNEDLFQYNTKVTVPFVLSNKNYGILWDNYSYSKFGDNREYAQLNQFRLYDADGKEGGLTATYVPGVRSGKSTVIRTESAIDYEDLKTIKNLPQNFPLDGSNVTYTGELEADQSGVYRFWLYYAGYTEVYINNVKVVPERWRTAWNPNCYKFSANFEKGKRVPIRIEWKPDGAVSYLALKAFSPVPDSEQKKLSLYSEMGNEINYYFIKGNNMDEVISGYRTLTGKSQIMPKWAMGYWQSRQRYKTQSELLGALKEFRRRQIPIDNIILDWFYWPETEWGSHDFDLKRFPDAKAMIDSIHQMNAKIMISVWPKFYVTTDHYKEFDKNGWMYQQAVKDSVLDWVGKGYVGSFYDAYSADARKLFWKQMNEKLYSKGIDAWWMDASEPDVYSNNDMAYRKKLCGPTVLGSSTKYFNTYALMNAKAIYEGQRGVDPDKRVFLLTRSGFAGLQRYSTATWSGDIGTRWEDMKAQIPAGLNFSMSGIPYWTMDIGGFCTEKRYANGQHEFDETGKENADLKEWRELNARWYQFGAFAPLFRAHGEFPFREVFNLAPENHPAYKSIVYYTKLRYNMMPYIYSLAGMTYFKDYTIMRALVMDFGKDTNVNNISDQYMFGPSLMVCPVYKYEARSRKVYFPETTGWYDFYTGEYVRGGQTQNVNAPYERMPLFVREGAIIPYGPDIQYTSEKPADHIALYIYGGQNGSFTLYEDEGDNYNYEKERYATIEFTYDESSESLIIGDRKGEFKGMLKERTFNVVYVDKTHSQPFDLKTKGKEIKYSGKKLVIKL